MSFKFQIEIWPIDIYTRDIRINFLSESLSDDEKKQIYDILTLYSTDVKMNPFTHQYRACIDIGVLQKIQTKLENAKLRAKWLNFAK